MTVEDALEFFRMERTACRREATKRGSKQLQKFYQDMDDEEAAGWRQLAKVMGEAAEIAIWAIETHPSRQGKAKRKRA
jgi:hypothetical protein